MNTTIIANPKRNKRANDQKMMLNKFECYQQQQQQQQQRSGGNMSVVGVSSSSTASAAVCSADFAAAAVAAAASKAERESIHSGQFMVSHFEAEEAQEDLEEDAEVKMLDPEDPSLSKPDETNPCMEVQLFVPSVITSHLEIETSLTKLFKCMNLAYSQKLTSPKWNHFKGVRLRWKDKIRLNNVIWRCWHMQFILKRKTPVCQFASPLDVDIHSNPQSVVLEGKYWKRQFTVIKAEYRKWRRNSKSKATGCLTNDTKSEFDFLEWSPLNDRNLMLSEDWTSDTLFSAINGPFPFPDPREIARGAGIADFIQPSLGPLQPSLDDIDVTFAELLQNTRLPSVPEEVTDEMLKSVDYGFSSIMGSEQMDSSNIMDVTAGSNVTQLQSNDDANMLELNTPISSMQFSDIDQQFAARGNEKFPQQQQLLNRVLTNLDESMMNAERTMALLAQVTTPTASAATSIATSGSATSGASPSRTQQKHYASGGAGDNSAMLCRQGSAEFPSKSVIKGRISKSFQRPFRREPHNYDKAQPTLHQTSIYQQMLAEQQKHQQHLQPNISAAALQHQAAANSFQQQQQQQQQLQYVNTSQFPQSPSTTLRGNNGGQSSFSYSAEPSMQVGGVGVKGYSIVQATSNVTNQNSTPALSRAGIAPSQPMLLNVKIEPPSSDVLSMFNLTNSNDVYAASANSYKPYPSLANFKKSASTGTNIYMRSGANTAGYNMSPDPQMQATAQLQSTASLPLSLSASQMPSLVSSLQMQLSPTSSQQQQQQQQQLHLTPPHQQHQHQQQQQQQHQQQQQQQQQQQPLQSTQPMLPKEMFRSNSLPLNVTLQKFDTRSGHDNNFAVPKYHAKSSKPRSRSNSIHQHMASGASASGTTTTSNLLVSQQLQAATSDPMLNSQLAQLLTSNSRMSSLGKQQSSSTSAISTLHVPMTAVPLKSPLSPAAQSSQAQPINVPVSGMFMSPTQSSSSSSSLIGATGVASPPTTAHEMLQQQQQQKQQQQKQQLQKSPKKSTSLPTPVTQQMLHSPPSKMLSYPLPAGTQINSANVLSLSPESFHDQDSPLSPTHSLKFPRDSQRRAGHIHAEQKRRYNIKNGFDLLHSLIPQLQQNPNAKLSKAAMLQKGADHIKHLRNERNMLKIKMEAMRTERDALNNSLTHLHSILPANGAPVTRQGTEHVRQLYEQYVRYRTMSNWKFWILGLILEPLLSSYTSSVSSASMEELRRTAFLWVDQHCSLIDLRPAVSNKLKYLSMNTDILSDPPSTLQEEVVKASQNTTGQHPNLHGT